MSAEPIETYDQKHERWHREWIDEHTEKAALNLCLMDFLWLEQVNLASRAAQDKFYDYIPLFDGMPLDGGPLRLIEFIG